MPPLVEESLTVQDNEVPPPLPHPQPMIPVGGRLAHFAHFWQNITSNQWVGPFYCKKRFTNSVQRTSTSFKSTHLFSPASKTRTGRRSQQSPPKEGSGGNNSGIPRILFKDISGSKEKRKTQIYYRSLNSESICSYSKFQNGDSEKSQKLHSSQRLGIFVRSDGRLFACPYSSSVSQISSLHSRQQDISIQAHPFGLSTNPFVFTQLMTAVASHLHTKAISLFPYLDD